MESLHHRDGIAPDLHGDIDDTFDAAFVHHLQDSAWILRVEMVVVVDDRKLRSLHLVHGRDQHGTRLKVAETKVDLGLRGYHSDKLVLSRSALTHVRRSSA